MSRSAMTWGFTMQVFASHLFDHLPYLRRYARALTGTAQRGDELVLRSLETAMLAPERFGLTRNARIPLYALVNLHFDEAGGGQGQPLPSPYPVERALAALPEGERRAYLLIALEGLSPAEAAAVLNEPAEGEIAIRFGHARERVRQAMVQKVLVVEDDSLLAADLENCVTSLGHEVCGTAVSEQAAIEIADRHEPTLALLDVCLADGSSGIEVAKRLRRRGVARTIFVTGFADEAENRDALHLGPIVSKPYTVETLDEAIQRAIFMPTPVAVT
jgi:DNA-directed RNA polymerase specialized sigma24 family protein/CheY-like chemotaxis protein